MSKKRNIVVFTGKPLCSKSYAPAIGALFPDERTVFLHTMLQGPMSFCYPRGAKWSSYPLVSLPEYHITDDFDWMPTVYSHPRRLTADPGIDPIAEIKKADLFICATDIGAADVSALELLFKKYRPQNDPAVYWYASTSKALSPDAVEEALAQKLNFWAESGAARDSGMVKRYFDWNYNINAQAILTKTMCAAGVHGSSISMSKYMLQFLYALKSGKTYSEHTMYTMMVKWTGTGKYGPRPLEGCFSGPFGSAASRSQIMVNLFELGLLDRSRMLTAVPPPDQAKQWHYSLSDTGRRFLANLHPDCRDIDLPFRLLQWREEGMATAKPKIDHYIKTFFGKQKRFLDKLGR